MMRCNICYLPIHDQTSKESCPRCQNVFHHDHLAAWLLDTEHCPVCRERMSESFLLEMRPKSEREKRRLEDIMRTLDGLGSDLSSLEQRHKNKIMASRSKEFGIKRTTLSEYAKIIVPLFFFGGFVIFLLIALINS